MSHHIIQLLEDILTALPALDEPIRPDTPWLPTGLYVRVKETLDGLKRSTAASRTSCDADSIKVLARALDMRTGDPDKVLKAAASVLVPCGSLEAALAVVSQERRRQDAKWGADRDLLPGLWFLILGEEVGEVSRAILEKESRDRVIAELAQVAAVAVAWIEAEMRARKSIEQAGALQLNEHSYEDRA